ncbi:hypothetical protein B0H16DRAFT_1452506 [Mycena metata]|uniref:Uncharacterized protein n=1 Tax=Mycena metata TaxID=1033252 RepID=A0AAD7JS20_9AGAR|nr:hypothetical protein B0H16DRAFT_1452506 [Mycena metata]
MDPLHHPLPLLLHHPLLLALFKSVSTTGEHGAFSLPFSAKNGALSALAVSSRNTTLSKGDRLTGLELRDGKCPIPSKKRLSRSEQKAYPRSRRQPGVVPQLLVWLSENSGDVTESSGDATEDQSPGVLEGTRGRREQDHNKGEVKRQ